MTIIETTDGGNDTVVETWTLEGCFLENVGYQQLDYAESGFQTIDLTVRFDNATQANGLMTALPEQIPGFRL